MKLLLYCTKSKPYLFKLNNKYYSSNENKSAELIMEDYIKSISLNGKIVAECDFEVEEITPFFCDDVEKFEKESCLNMKQVVNYLNGFNGYAIHIKNLHIFDEPKELSDFAHYIDKEHTSVITKAPQNMCYAYEIDGCFLKRKILISIRPEWLCKILNGEKTIEVRKKVLRCMYGK